MPGTIRGEMPRRPAEPQDADALTTYRAKRDFEHTPEPRARAGRAGKQPTFVIQQHDATAMHYDFRLEVEGVLKSWAVPRGPSMNPRDKRLAMPTEDHPMAYGSFEGVIPEGQYGAGPVIVWDTGTYRNLTERDGSEVPMSEALRNGHAKFWLEGEKLRGGWALTRTPVGGGKREKWLLGKRRAAAAAPRRNPVSTQQESVVSGKTIAEMRRG